MVRWPMRKVEAIFPSPYRAIVLVALTWLAFQLGIHELGGRVGVFVLAIAVAVGGASIVKYVWLRLRATRHRHHGSLHTTRPPSQTPEAKVPMSSPGKDSTLDIENTFFSREVL